MGQSVVLPASISRCVLYCYDSSPSCEIYCVRAALEGLVMCIVVDEKKGLCRLRC